MSVVVAGGDGLTIFQRQAADSTRLTVDTTVVSDALAQVEVVSTADSAVGTGVLGAATPPKITAVVTTESLSKLKASLDTLAENADQKEDVTLLCDTLDLLFEGTANNDDGDLGDTLQGTLEFFKDNGYMALLISDDNKAIGAELKSTLLTLTDGMIGLADIINTGFTSSSQKSAPNNNPSTTETTPSHAEKIVITDATIEALLDALFELTGENQGLQTDVDIIENCLTALRTTGNDADDTKAKLKLALDSLSLGEFAAILVDNKNTQVSKSLRSTLDTLTKGNEEYSAMVAEKYPSSSQKSTPRPPEEALTDAATVSSSDSGSVGESDDAQTPDSNGSNSTTSSKRANQFREQVTYASENFGVADDTVQDEKDKKIAQLQAQVARLEETSVKQADAQSVVDALVQVQADLATLLREREEERRAGAVATVITDPSAHRGPILTAEVVGDVDIPITDPGMKSTVAHIENCVSLLQELQIGLTEGTLTDGESKSTRILSSMGNAGFCNDMVKLHSHDPIRHQRIIDTAKDSVIESKRGDLNAIIDTWYPQPRGI